MTEAYQIWIDEFAAQRGGRVTNQCTVATALMATEFPELRRVCGLAHLAGGYTDQHFWCVTADGAIVDPTAAQYERAGGVVAYEELDVNDPETWKIVPSGRCPNCGADVYEQKTFCDPVPGEYDCGAEMAAELNMVRAPL